MQYQQATILVVEDEDADYALTFMLLKREHIQNAILRVRSGQDALDLFASGALKGPVVLLLDINMPGMSGIHFLDLFRRVSAKNKVEIFILSHHEPDYVKSLVGDREVAGILQKDHVHKFIHALGPDSRITEAINGTQTFKVVDVMQ